MPMFMLFLCMLATIFFIGSISKEGVTYSQIRCDSGWESKRAPSLHHHMYEGILSLSDGSTRKMLPGEICKEVQNVNL